MSADSEKMLKVRSIYQKDKVQNPTEEEKDSNVKYGENILLKCFEALRLNKLILQRVKTAVYVLQNYKTKNFEIDCLTSNLKFFEMIEKRKKVLEGRCQSKPTVLAERVLRYEEDLIRKSFLHDKELEGDDERWTLKVPKIVDGFSVFEDLQFSKDLSGILKNWSKCLEKPMVSGSIAFATLRTLIICGEYLHLLKLKIDEVRVWNLAYQLAASLGQLTACVYITSRCLKIKYIEDSWISCCKKYIENNKEFQDSEVVAMFWLELASFYFDCQKIKKAQQLLEKVKKLRCYNYPKQTNDPLIFGYTSDIEFRNYFTSENTDQEGYVQLMVKIHYVLNDFHDSRYDCQKYDEIEYKLLGFSTMYDLLYDIIIPSVSLHSHYEIYSHMVDWFMLAQYQGWTLRIADCLKYFCYIDLLFFRVTLCEVKLDELEKILCLDKFEEWPLDPKRKKKYVYDGPKIHKDKPQLTKKLFRVPACFNPSSSPCECFICNNDDYMYSLFACAYIRAQLYSFVDYEIESEQYFCGASKIQQVMEQTDTVEYRTQQNYTWKRNRNYTIDYLIFLVDFGLYIKKFVPEDSKDAMRLIQIAIDVAEENDLSNYPTAVFAIEMKLEHQVYNLDTEALFTAISVPHTIEKDDDEDDKGKKEEKGPITRSKSARLALEQKTEGPMTRSKAAALLKASKSSKNG